jgi:hypothetical protein
VYESMALSGPMRHDMSHNGLTDTSSFAREDYIHYALLAPKLSRQQEAH